MWAALGCRVGSMSSGSGGVAVVAAEEVGAAVADGAEVVDREGAQRDVLVEEGAEGLVFGDCDLGGLVRVAIPCELGSFAGAVRMRFIF